MRDGDPHKLVPIREMFKRIIDTLDEIATVQAKLMPPNVPADLASGMLEVVRQVDELQDIMAKADD